MSMVIRRQLLATALCVVLAVVASNAFDRLLWHVVGAALVVGVLTIVVSQLAGWPRVAALFALVVGAIGFVVFFEGGSLVDVVDVVTDGPRRLLTTEWPSPAVPTTVGAVMMLVAAVTVVAVDLASRDRFHLAPLAVIVVGWLAALALGAPERPMIGWLIASGLLAAAFATVRLGGDHDGVVAAVKSDRTLLVSIAVLALVGVGSANAIAWADRADPRRTQEADVSAAVLDPVEEMVALRRADPTLALYEVTNRSRLVGDSLPARWRLAALDQYDGTRWVPTATLRPIGGRLSTAEEVMADRSPSVLFSLEFLSDDFDLVPLPGRPISVDAEVQTDLDRVVVQLAERPGVGDVLEVESQVSLTSRSALAPNVSTPQVDEIAQGFAEQAARLAGDGEWPERIRRLEQTMRSEWSLDSGAPGAGQQLALIERFITDTQRGTAEQFVTGFVLLARSLGLNARVVTGFIVPPEAMRAPLLIESSMAAVWPEIEFVDEGWVAFDPVPALEETDDEEPPTPPEAQSPAAVQPPIAPPSDESDEVDEASIDVSRRESGWSVVGRWAGRIGAVSGLTLLPFAIVIAAIVGVKWWRRRNRIRGVGGVARVHGAWANTTDALIDAGLSIAPSWTDDHIAVAGVAHAPTVPHELRRLAAMATEATFGSPDSVATMADDAAITAAAVDAAIRSDRTRWQRVRWRLSLRSLRSATRSPVTDH